MEWKNRKTHWYEAISSALNFPFVKDVSQNCFVLDAVNLKNEEVSQNSFVFDCQVQELRKSRFVFDVVKFKN